MQYLNASQRDEVRRLISLMKDPKYWREQDPEVVRTVRVGLRRIYRGEEPGMEIRARPDDGVRQHEGCEAAMVSAG